MTTPYHTIEKLNSMRLKTMANAFESQRKDPKMHEFSFEERFGFIVDAEADSREDNKQKRLFRQSNLRLDAYPENINYNAARGMERELITHLLTCDFIQKGLNVLMTGPTGIGKTYLTCAIGRAAITKGYPVYSIRVARLLEDFQIAHGDGSLRKLRNKISKYDLLILDDWGLSPMTTLGRHELLELIDERVTHGSIMITSQLPIDAWHEYINEPTTADAILDRVVQKAYRIELHGESLRKTDMSLPANKGVK